MSEAGAPPSLPARFPWKIYGVLFAALVLFTLAPVISVVTAATIAGGFHCALDEGSVHPCLIGGADWGETLYALGVLGWLMLVTLPLGAIGLLGAAIVLLIHRQTWLRRWRPPAP